MSSTKHKPADKVFREGLLEVRIFADIRDMGAASAEEIAQVPGVPEKVAETVYRFLREESGAEEKPS